MYVRICIRYVFEKLIYSNKLVDLLVVFFNLEYHQSVKITVPLTDSTILINLIFPSGFILQFLPVYFWVWVQLLCGPQKQRTSRKLVKCMQRSPIKRWTRLLYGSSDSSSQPGKQLNCGEILSALWCYLAALMAAAAAAIKPGPRPLCRLAVPTSVLLLRPKMLTWKDHQMRKSILSRPSIWVVLFALLLLLHCYQIHCHGKQMRLSNQNE